MRKVFTFLLAVTLLLTFAPVAAFAAETSTAGSWLNAANLDKGVVGIDYESAGTARTKLMITKEKTSYTYDLAAKGTEEFFPLQMGNGSYKISILENTSGNKYKSVYSKTVEVAIANAGAVYLNSVQNVSWAGASNAIAKAKELTKNLTSDSDKVEAIYNFVVNAISYDNSLAATVAAGYIPDVDSVLAEGTGICYDYASLFAAMTRSIGIPTKLEMGTSEYVTEYHAWNEVQLNGEWVTVDSTVGGEMVKDAAKYTVAKTY